MKRILIVSLFFILMTSSVFAQLAHNTPSFDILESFDIMITYQRMKDSSISLLMVNNEPTGICSGTVIKNEYGDSIVLTAKHCMPNKPIWLRIFYNNKWQGEEIYADEALAYDYVVSKTDDLALLFFKQKIQNKNSARIAKNSSNINDIVLHIGYPEMTEYFAFGQVIKKTKHTSYVKMEAIPGCSGGGIYNTKGELTGVLYAKIAWTKNTTTLFNDLDKINKFLAENNIYLERNY